jgi:hypothetical protein
VTKVTCSRSMSSPRDATLYYNYATTVCTHGCGRRKRGEVAQDPGAHVLCAGSHLTCRIGWPCIASAKICQHADVLSPPPCRPRLVLVSTCPPAFCLPSTCPPSCFVPRLPRACHTAHPPLLLLVCPRPSACLLHTRTVVRVCLPARVCPPARIGPPVRVSLCMVLCLKRTACSCCKSLLNLPFCAP